MSETSARADGGEATELEGLATGPRWWTEPTWGVHADRVAAVHVSGGFFVAKKTINPYGAPGFLFLAEPGLEAAKVSAGCGYLTVFGSIVGRAVVLRTYDEPRYGEPWSTYVGIEGQVPVWLRTLLRVGALRGTSAGSSGNWLITVSLGYGM